MINVVAFFQGYSFLYVYPNEPGFNDILGRDNWAYLCGLLNTAYAGLSKCSTI